MSKNIFVVSFIRGTDDDWLPNRIAQRMIRAKELVILDPKMPMRPRGSSQGGWAMAVMHRAEFDYTRARILAEPDYAQELLLKSIRYINFVRESPENHKDVLEAIRNPKVHDLLREWATNDKLFKELLLEIFFHR